MSSERSGRVAASRAYGSAMSVLERHRPTLAGPIRVYVAALHAEAAHNRTVATELRTALDQAEARLRGSEADS